MRSASARLRVAWVDTDTSGRIHYTAAMRYFEHVEHALMRDVYASAPGEARLSLPRVHVEADYKAALGFEDEIDCHVRVAKLGQSSITYRYSVTRLDGLEAVTGTIVAVSIGEDGRPCPISTGLRAALSAD